jgi:hypothetical protein
VQNELDRFLTHSSADPRLIARLARLRRDDDTWSVLSLPAWSPEIRGADGDSLQFGIQYGKRVEFEYEITTASSTSTRPISELLAQSLAEPSRGSSFLQRRWQHSSRNHQSLHETLQRLARGTHSSSQSSLRPVKWTQPACMVNEQVLLLCWSGRKFTRFALAIAPVDARYCNGLYSRASWRRQQSGRLFRQWCGPVRWP